MASGMLLYSNTHTQVYACKRAHLCVCVCAGNIVYDAMSIYTCIYRLKSRCFFCLFSLNHCYECDHFMHNKNRKIACARLFVFINFTLLLPYLFHIVSAVAFVTKASSNDFYSFLFCFMCTDWM